MKFVTFFRFAPATVEAMINRPSDRMAAVNKMAATVGGRVEAYYWMFGRFDGLVIIETPTSLDVGAISLATTSSGAFSHFETHELIDVGQIDAMLERAKGARASYVPPGQVPTHA